MSDLFGEPTPLRAVLHFNLYDGRTRLDWDILVENPDTQDLLALEAHVNIPADKLGPQISRALLKVLEQFGDDEAS